MLARGTASVEPYEGNLDWAMEPKLDGFRLLVCVEPDGDIEGYARSLNPQNLAIRSPWICEELLELDLPNPRGRVVLDGELVAAGKHPTFHGHMSSCMKSLPQNCQFLQVTQDEYLHYRVFDVLEVGGDDMRPLAWAQRRALIATKIGIRDDRLVSVTDVRDPSEELFLEWSDEGAEGVILKNVHSPYESGKRTKTWLKRKGVATADVVIMGFTDARYGKGGKFYGKIGAIEFGVYRSGQLVKIGQCSGMLDSVRDMFTAEPEAYIGRVMEVKHGGFQTKKVRFPRFKRLRDDKEPEECLWDQI